MPAKLFRHGQADSALADTAGTIETDYLWDYSIHGIKKRRLNRRGAELFLLARPSA
jgi:hypothetical protein